MTNKGLKLFAVGIFIGFAIIICIDKQTITKIYAEKNQAAIAEGHKVQQEKLAEERYKNIKVFRGTPASQLFNSMFYMRGSLGVSCNHCHVNFEDFEKDDNPAKNTARRMIEMVRELNQKNFGGQNIITCNTCHRGQVKPSAPLNFAPIIEKQESKASNAKAKQPASVVETTPTVEQIFDRFITATGGKIAHEKLKTSVMSGSMFSSEGWKAPLRIYKEAPNKYFVTFDIPAEWTSFNAFDGSTGWSQDNRGLHDVKGPQLDRFKRDGAFFSPLELKGQYLKLTFLGKEKINEREVYAVEGQLPNAGSEKLYFDVNLSLLVRITWKTETLLGELQDQIDIMDYKKVDGVKLPFTVIRSAPDFSSAYRLETVKHNVPIRDIKFGKPKKALKSVQK